MIDSPHRKVRHQLQFASSDMAYILKASEDAGGISFAEVVRRCVRHCARCGDFDPRREQLPIETGAST